MQDDIRPGDDDFPFKATAVWLTGVVVVLLGLTWLVQGNDFFLLKVFAPKMEAVRRETFEESKAYNQGMAQELRRQQFEYIRARPEQRAAIASLIRQQFAEYDVSKLPSDLQPFLLEMRQAPTDQGGR